MAVQRSDSLKVELFRVSQTISNKQNAVVIKSFEKNNGDYYEREKE